MRSRLLFALPFLVFACGDSSDSGTSPPPNRAPVIDSLDAPTEVTASGGKYTVTLVLKFHDDDNDAVDKLRLQIPAGKFDQTTPIQGAVPQAAGATLSLQLDAATVPANTYDLEVSVFDSLGHESVGVQKQITFK